MRRILPFLIRLYPKAWRERYESEFTALLEDVDPGWRTLIDVFNGGVAMQLKTLSGLRSSRSRVCLVSSPERPAAASAL